MMLAAGSIVGCRDVPIEVLSQGDPVTFYGDVAPSLARSCWCCHRAGGIGPSLLTAEETMVHYDAVLRSIREGSMPPLPPGPEPVLGCETLRRQAPPMEDADVEMLTRWREGGYRLGDPATAPELPSDCWAATPSEPLRIELPAQGPVDEGRVLSRCFDLGMAAPEGGAVVGGRLIDTPSTLRSFVVWAELYDGGAELMEVPCPPYEPWMVHMLVGVWSDDQGMDLPAGVGIPTSSDQQLFARAVYDNAFAEGDLTPRPLVFDLATVPAESLRKHAAWAHVGPASLYLEPSGDTSAGAEAVLGAAAREVLGAVLQMHDHGSSATAVLGDEGAAACVLEHRDWRAGDVRPVFFDPALADLSNASIACEYDLGARSEPILQGHPPEGETCLLSILVEAP